MIRLTIVATCILFKIFLPNFAFASNLNPEKILDSVDDLYRSNTSYGILTLSVTTKNWQRTLTLEQWSKGENSHLIKVLNQKKKKTLLHFVLIIMFGITCPKLSVLLKFLPP